MMTEQELDQIIVYGIPDTTRRQAEVLLGQLKVHLELLDIKSVKEQTPQRPRHAPLAPMSPFEGDGFDEHTEAMQQSRLREIQNSAAGRKTTAVNNMLTRQHDKDNEWSGG